MNVDENDSDKGNEVSLQSPHHHHPPQSPVALSLAQCFQGGCRSQPQDLLPLPASKPAEVFVRFYNFAFVIKHKLLTGVCTMELEGLVEET